jgi:hypothetical protein
MNLAKHAETSSTTRNFESLGDFVRKTSNPTYDLRSALIVDPEPTTDALWPLADLLRQFYTGSDGRAAVRKQ